MEETIASNIEWINKQHEDMKSVEQVVIESLDRSKGKTSKKLQEICRDFKIVFRKIEIIEKKAANYDKSLSVVLIIDELHAYTQIAQQILDKIQKLNIMPK